MYRCISILAKIWANWEIILFQKAKNLQIIKLINEKVIFYLNWSTLKKNILKYSKLHWTHIYQQLKSPPRSSKISKRNPSVHPNFSRTSFGLNPDFILTSSRPHQVFFWTSSRLYPDLIFNNKKQNMNPTFNLSKYKF